MHIKSVHKKIIVVNNYKMKFKNKSKFMLNLLIGFIN